MKRKSVLYLVLFCFLVTACGSLQQKQVEFNELTTLQKAQYVVKQSKKVEDHYKEIVKMYSDSYGNYITDTSKENLNRLVRMRDIHSKTVKLYDKWQPLHNQLVDLVDLYSGIDDEILIAVTSQVLDLTKQILMQKIIE